MQPQQAAVLQTQVFTVQFFFLYFQFFVSFYFS